MRASHLSLALVVLLVSCGSDDGDTPVDAGEADASAGALVWTSFAAGAFQMGSDVHVWEQPIHQVQVPAFAMLRTEVTVRQYAECVTASACSAPSLEAGCFWDDPAHAQRPATCLTWQQAADFCAWIGGRLPSESEWEFAARSGGQDSTFPWGDDAATCDHAVFKDVTLGDGCGTSDVWEVCSKSPTGDTVDGLCDMAGNAWEWIQDWSHGCYDCAQCPDDECDASTAAPNDGAAWEIPASSLRILRGGSYDVGDDELRTAARHAFGPDANAFDVGFRCVR